MCLNEIICICTLSQIACLLPTTHSSLHSYRPLFQLFSSIFLWPFSSPHFLSPSNPWSLFSLNSNPSIVFFFSQCRLSRYMIHSLVVFWDVSLPLYFYNCFIHGWVVLLLSVHQEHFLEVVGGQEFLLLPLDEMERLLTSDDINVPDEETVVTSLLTWVHHDATTRQQHLPLLLANIRLPLLQPQVRAWLHILRNINLLDFTTFKTVSCTLSLIYQHWLILLSPISLVKGDESSCWQW